MYPSLKVMKIDRTLGGIDRGNERKRKEGGRGERERKHESKRGMKGENKVNVMRA